MNDRIGDEKTLRSYLLGNLGDEVVHSQIEKQLLTDDQFARTLDLAEEELIEAYLGGELSDDEAQRFEQFFLASPEHRRQLRLTENLRRISVGAETVVPQAKRASFDWNATLSMRWLRFAALALILIIVGAGIWRIAFYRSDADRGIDDLRAAYSGRRVSESRLSAFPDHVPLSSTRGGDVGPKDPAANEMAGLRLLQASRDGTNIHALHGLAIYYLLGKKYDESIRTFEKAIAASPRDSSLNGDAGAAYLEFAKSLGDGDRARKMELLNSALKHLDLAIQSDPRLLEAYFNRALALEAVPSPEEAKKAWNAYLERDSNSKWAEEARQHLQKLNTESAPELSSDELETRFLAAVREGSEETAARLISGNRELINFKYLPQRLAMSYVTAPEERRDELISALRYAADLEMKNTGDTFAKEIALFYSTSAVGRVDDLKTAQDLVRSAYADCKRSSYPSCLASVRSAAELFKRAGDDPEALLANYIAGYAEMNLNTRESSLLAAEQFSAIERSARDRGYIWLEATVQHWTGGIRRQLKDHTRAKKAFQRGLELGVKLNDAFVIQRNLLALAGLEIVAGNRQRSLDDIAQVLYHSARPESSLRQRTRSLIEVYDMLSTLGLDNAALAVALESVPAADTTRDEMYMVQAHQNVGIALARTGRVQDGRKMLTHAGEIAAGISDAALKAKMNAMVDLYRADVELDAGDADAAGAGYERALQYFSSSTLPHRIAEAHEGLLRAAVARHDDAQVEAEIAENVRIAEEYRTQILEEQERSGYFDRKAGLYDIAAGFEFDRGRFERAFDHAERSHSRSLLDLLQKGGSVETRESVKSVVLGDYAEPLDLAQIRQRMPADSQILEYIVSDDKLLIFLLDRERFIARAAAIRSGDLNARIDEYLKAVTAGSARAADIRTMSRDLYDVLIGPVRDDLDPAKELCLVPSNALYMLPFASLTGEDGRPLISRLRIVYSPSANVFIHSSDDAATRELSSDEKLLAVGDPAFDRTQFAGLSDLPEARDEVRDAAKLYTTKTLVDTHATKDEFITSLPDADVVHFAGHYVAVPEAPMSSFMLFADTGGDPAGNMLTNLELAGLKLPKTRLMVLAACRSGVEAYSGGEGLVGLSRTFLAARVPLVLASQWEVDSRATALLMKRFHELRRLERLSTTEALRRAQLEMINDPAGRFSDPFYWSAFAVYGGHAGF